MFQQQVNIIAQKKYPPHPGKESFCQDRSPDSGKLLIPIGETPSPAPGS